MFIKDQKSRFNITKEVTIILKKILINVVIRTPKNIRYLIKKRNALDIFVYIR